MLDLFGLNVSHAKLGKLRTTVRTNPACHLLCKYSFAGTWQARSFTYCLRQLWPTKLELGTQRLYGLKIFTICPFIEKVADLKLNY